MISSDCNLVGATLSKDTRFYYFRDDNYWVPGNTDRHGLYEPEVDWLLRRASKDRTHWIDCGANLGYWSIVASSAHYGSQPAVAIEASRANFEILTPNAQANNNRIKVLHCAIFGETGRRVRLFGKKHYGMSLQPDWHPAEKDQSEEVMTITVDDVAKDYLPRCATRRWSSWMSRGWRSKR